MKGKTLLILAVLGSVPFIMVLGNSMLIPVLPEMQKQLGITHFHASLVITMFSIPAGIVIPFAGFLSDRLGRKVIIAPALLLYGIGGLIAGIAALCMKECYWIIIGGRIVQGIGAAGTAPVAMALVGDIFTTKERSKALGYIEASNGLGKVVSPILGSIIAIIAWYATFFLFPLLTVPAAAAVWFLLKEPNAGGSQQGIRAYLGSVGQIFQNKAGFLITAFFTGALALLILFGILFFLSDYLESSLKLFGVKKGFVLAIPVLAMSSISLTTGLVIKKKIALMKKIIVTGLGVITLSLGLLPFLRNPWLDVAVMSSAGVGVGMILPCLNTLITGSASIQERGMITSLYGGVRFFGVAAGPPLFGLLENFGRYVMFWSSAGAALIMGILAVIALPSAAPGGQKAGQDRYAGSGVKYFGKLFLETITLKNSVGRLVTRKPFQTETGVQGKDRERDGGHREKSGEKK